MKPLLFIVGFMLPETPKPVIYYCGMWDKDQRYTNPPDSLYTAGSTLTITGPSFPSGQNFSASGGTYTTGQILLPGTYTVAYNTGATPLPTNYSFTTSSIYQVTVGISCSKGTNPDASCGNPNSGSINNLDFGVTDETVWTQSVCWDVRDDITGGGTYQDPIPSAPSCGGVTGAYNSISNGSCSTGAGIIYSCQGTFDFGLGSANVPDQKAGGNGSDAECFKPGGLDVIRTSYDYIMTTARESNITPTNLDNTVNPDPNTSCDATNCTLPDNLPKGIYAVDGDLHLNAFAFPTAATTSAYIFAVKGDLYIDGNTTVPRNSVAFFTSGGTIYVAPVVGQSVNATTLGNGTVNDPNLEGLYSADGSFVIQRDVTLLTCNVDGSPVDLKLNVVGSVITNAAQNGGSVVNQRDLCIYDKECSSLTTGDNNGLTISYLLNLYIDGGFLQHRNFNWEELKP